MNSFSKLIVRQRDLAAKSIQMILLHQEQIHVESHKEGSHA